MSQHDPKAAPKLSFVALSHRTLAHPGFGGLLLTSFVLGLAYSFVIPFMSLWGTLHVGMSALTFGLFMTVTSVSGIVLSTVLARWSDAQLSRRFVLLLGGTGGLIGYLAYAFLTNPVALTLIGSVTLGVATVNFSQLFAHAREELARPESEVADPSLSMSVLRACFALAWTIGPVLAALIMVRFGYRGIFLTASGIFCVFLLGVLCFVPQRGPAPREQRAAPEPLRRVLTRPIILTYFTAFVFTFAAFTLNTMNLPLVMMTILGGDEHHVGIAFGIAPVFEIPFMVWLGGVAARGHQAAVIRFGLFVGACYFLALMFVNAPFHVYPVQILSAAAIAVTTSVAIPFFQDLLPGRPGLATTIYSNAYTTGSLIGYLSFGLLVGAVGHRRLFLVCFVLSGVALVLFMFTRRQNGSVRAAEPEPALDPVGEGAVFVSVAEEVAPRPAGK